MSLEAQDRTHFEARASPGEREKGKPRERQDTKQLVEAKSEVQKDVFNLKKSKNLPYLLAKRHIVVVKFIIQESYLRWWAVSTVLSNSFSIIDFPTIKHGNIVISAVVVSLHIKLLKL